MITVTLGTISYPFNRAIDWLATLLEKGAISEHVFVQHGTSDVTKIINHPLVSTSPKVPFPEFVHLVEKSRLVISHAGQGTTRDLAMRGVNFVTIPRLAQYHEHVDEHQLMFAKSVASRGVRYCTTLEDLENIINAPPVILENPLFEGPKLSDFLISRYPT